MKCGSCGFEWIEKPGQVLEICPICQNRFSVTEKAPAEITAAGTIKEIIKKYGISILDEKARFIGLFGDYAPKLSHEKRILQIAVYDNIANYFVRCSVSDREKNLAKAQKNLLEIFNEAASREILEMFAGAFDWDITLPETDCPAPPIPEYIPVPEPVYDNIRTIMINDAVEGQGTYTGETDHSGSPHGQGTAIYYSGSVYEGEWEYGQYNGKGIMTYSTGNVYNGEWELGDQSGHGRMDYKNGDVYEGEWKYGVQDGKGKMTYINGFTYEGEWKYAARNGYGVLTYPNGIVYEGGFENGSYHGKGKMTFPDGTFCEGIWKCGKLIPDKL